MATIRTNKDIVKASEMWRDNWIAYRWINITEIGDSEVIYLRGGARPIEEAEAAAKQFDVWVKARRLADGRIEGGTIGVTPSGVPAEHIVHYYPNIRFWKTKETMKKYSGIYPEQFLECDAETDIEAQGKMKKMLIELIRADYEPIVVLEKEEELTKAP